MACKHKGQDGGGTNISNTQDCHQLTKVTSMAILRLKRSSNQKLLQDTDSHYLVVMVSIH